jgi:hypothetical protein
VKRHAHLAFAVSACFDTRAIITADPAIRMHKTAQSRPAMGCIHHQSHRPLQQRQSLGGDRDCADCQHATANQYGAPLYSIGRGMCVRRSPPPDPMQSLVAQTLISSTRCAQELLALNNFNSLLEVLAGLNLAPVQRLKRTWRVWSETVGGGNKCQQTLINSSPTRPTLGSAKCSS